MEICPAGAFSPSIPPGHRIKVRARDSGGRGGLVTIRCRISVRPSRDGCSRVLAVLASAAASLKLT
ncbi:MAG: hypothetical protein ACTSUE_14635 [Promethearchaeota archaeon]